MDYFDTKESIFHYNQFNDKHVLETLANRFIADNPAYDYLLHLDNRQPIVVDKKGQVHLNYNELFPNAQIGAIAQSEAYFNINHVKTTTFKIRCYGPTKVFVNDALVFESAPSQENFRRDNLFAFELQETDNHIVIESEKTSLGFGVVFGNNMPQWESTHFFSNDQAGFITKLKNINTELDFSKSHVFEDGIYVFKSNIQCQIPTEFEIKNHSEASFDIYLDQNKVESCAPSKSIKLSVKSGETPVYLVYEGANPIQSISNVILSYDIAKMKVTSKVKGNQDLWIYSGPFSHSLDFSKFDQMNQLLADKSGNKTYWRGLDQSAVRPFQSSSLFGFWSYPMGVTLYGLLLSGRYLENEQWKNYATKSLNLICDWDEYALFDKENYHYPGINTQLYWLDDLDDCGSFGSFMLEAEPESGNPAISRIAERIANFMINEQKREADGAYSRHDDTMWIDDLYMSVPFLVRYYAKTKDEKYLNEAANQLLRFKKRFFMPEKNLMSHIYDPINEQANKIPWSRGNGWVIFSLSELLKFIPEHHEKKDELLVFFNQMIDGILKTQDEAGLWHQVLDEPSTYLESSSTSMFICALSRGIRLGYLEPQYLDAAKLAAFKAWEGLQKIAIDCQGNLYGVCRGSGFSFSKSYYRDLSWKKNDPHGIGIAILAGVEKMMLTDYLNT